MKAMPERIKNLLKQLGSGLYEREDILAKCLLAALSGESTFLFGPPGTAKSLIARRIAKAFKDTQYFECLMSRFTTPEEIFGPVSLKSLKEDRYLRKTEEYLPTSRFAFLDEIWKSGPGILNTLLTIVNERKFRNDGKVEKVPLKGIVAASNETPATNQGLDALYDRFIIRLKVSPLKAKDNFMALLDGTPVSSDVVVDDELSFGEDEWNDMLDRLSDVHFSEEAKNVLHAIRKRIEEYNAKAEAEKKTPLYVSDRRWQKIARILKTAAFLCDRNEILPVDLMILSDCLWNEPSQLDDTRQIVEDSVRDLSGYGSKEFEDLHNDIVGERDVIDSTLSYTEPEYKTVKMFGEQEVCFQFTVCYAKEQRITIFVPLKNINTSDDFHPYDSWGIPLNDESASDGRSGEYPPCITCNFNGGDVCSYTIKYRNGYDEPAEEKGYATPSILHFVGDKKPVKPETRQKLRKNVIALRRELAALQKQVEAYRREIVAKNHTPFVPENQRNVVVSGIDDYMSRIKQDGLQLERLEKCINEHPEP